jgi:hypothetical protein
MKRFKEKSARKMGTYVIVSVTIETYKVSKAQQAAMNMREWATKLKKAQNAWLARARFLEHENI